MLIVGAGVGAGITYAGLRLNPTGSGAVCSSNQTLTIGELLDLSSDLASQGTRAKDSSILAIEDINAFLSAAGCNLRFANSVTDYALDDSKALTAITSFAASGIQVVVGPLNSGSAAAILQYANSNHIVLISPSSTSVALSIADDYLFRTAPNDRWQGQADARMMRDRQANAVIIVQRHDAYGDALANATGAYFKVDGGTVIDTIPYAKTLTTFSTVLDQVQSDYNTYHTANPTAKIALDFISFEEFGAMILQAKNNYPSFPWSTPWFGVDGEAQDAVITNSTYGGPVAQVILPSTLYGFLNNTKTQALFTKFASRFPGNICDAYCLGTYDDLWIAALATLQAGSYSGTAIKSVMLTVANNFYGVTGPNQLEASGDRVATIYQIWKVVTSGTSQTWVYAGVWDSASDAVNWSNAPPSL